MIYTLKDLSEDLRTKVYKAFDTHLMFNEFQLLLLLRFFIYLQGADSPAGDTDLSLCKGEVGGSVMSPSSVRATRCTAGGESKERCWREPPRAASPKDTVQSTCSLAMCAN